MTASVTVQNPSPTPGTSVATNFTVNNPAPTLTSLTPSSVGQGQAATITLAGAGFVSGSVVQWNGSARPTTFAGAASLQVALSATDLANSGTGLLTVANPVPGGGTSAAATLSIAPVPTITNVSFSGPASTGCNQTVQITITGTNFTGSLTTATVNGVANISYPSTVSPGVEQVVLSVAPAVLTANTVTVTAANGFGSPLYPSSPYTVTWTVPPYVDICTSPSPALVYANTTFLINVTATQNVSATPIVTAGTLPAGITQVSAPQGVSIPSAGASLAFAASSSVVPGTYTIPLAGQAGSVAFSGTAQITVNSGTPIGFSFLDNNFDVALPPGTSQTLTFTPFTGNASADYQITAALSALPPGVTATLSPASLILTSPIQTPFQVVLTASPTAPLSQNFPVTLTGTAAAPVPAATSRFLIEVTPPPGSLTNNRADFTPTAATPAQAVFDSTHNQIFSSNPSWNRVDILSDQTHQITGSINIRNPQGIDLSPDNSTLWVATGSQQVYAVNTTTLALTRYTVPNLTTPVAGPWEPANIVALSDGSLMLQTGYSGTGTAASNDAFVWVPGSNTLTSIAFPPGLLRSGDHGHVFSMSGNTVTCQVSVYNVNTKLVTAFPQTSSPCGVYATNSDGSLIVEASGLYDGNGNLAAGLPAAPVTLGISSAYVFSPDDSTLYFTDSPYTLTYDVATRTLKGVAPSLAAYPFAIDPAGLLLGFSNFGIAFDDPSYYQTYAASQPTVGSQFALPTPNSGPLAGGTISSSFPDVYLTPDVWYGQTRGSVSVQTDFGYNALTITSPAASAPGPVNLKYLFPDGTEYFQPQAFTYSVYPQYATLAGASPNGGVPGQIAGYGLPQSAGGGTLTVGGAAATITTKSTQSTGEPFPSTFLNYTVPAGIPGWADLQVQTPNGTASLPKSVFYARSVTDYPSSDTFNAVLYDRKRNQVYLSTNNHIDVFSMSSLNYVSSLTPAVLGSKSQFTGLAMTPDGSLLLAANLLDGSLAVIDPDNPINTYAIAVAGFAGTNNCTVGPQYVTATNNGLAFVVTGSTPGTAGCPTEGNPYLLNLVSRTSSYLPNISTCSLYLHYPFTTNFGADSPLDGSLVVLGGGSYGKICIYSVASNTYTQAGTSQTSFPASIAGDGNIVGSGSALYEPTGSSVGSMAFPTVYYSGNSPTGILLNPRLNDSGSLYYWPYPSYFEIFDVPTGRLRLRFSLAETVQNVIAPLALDGLHDVFLVTNQGLTVVDLGIAPISIGHLSPSTASPGTSIQIRGSGFAAGITAQVGGQSATVTFTDENTLTLTMPSLPSGIYNLTLTNLDGSTYTLQSAIQAP